MNLYYKECEIGDNIAAYLDTCELSEIPDELKQWFEKTREQVAEIGVELKNELIEQLSEKDVKDYYEIAGYLTGTIASFFIGAGEAKTASKAGKLGKAKQLKIKNPSKAIGMNINEIESIKGYKIVTKTDGTKYLRRENGMTNKLEKLSVDKNDIIIKAEKKVKTRLPRSHGEWKNTMGNSKWIPENGYIPQNFNPENKTWQQILKEYKIDGIDYVNGYPDFSKISKGDVTITGFSNQRYGKGGNFDKADEALALLRTKKGKPCTADDVTLWREKNKYTWHEEVDCKTMKKVPSVIHGNMSHNGGIAKMNNNNQKTQLKEVKFDD